MPSKRGGDLPSLPRWAVAKGLHGAPFHKLRVI
jgi:hypothetical protein